MNNVFTKETLTAWIADLITAAKNDDNFDVAWFKPTENFPVSIVGGWQDGYNPDDADLFCLSKVNPKYCMCIKICENNGPYSFVDFELLDMPEGENSELEDTCISLEWNDDPAQAADFFMFEWERLMEERELSIDD
jgi:hypothetical protein